MLKRTRHLTAVTSDLRAAILAINKTRNIVFITNTSKIAKAVIEFVAAHPACLDLNVEDLNCLLIGRLYRFNRSYLNQNIYVSRIHSFFDVAKWLLANNMRILLSLNPKLRGGS